MRKEPDWLQAERSGQNEIAEAMFARIVAGMPLVPPSADFVDRTVQAVWRARARRRLFTRVAVITAALLAGIGYMVTMLDAGVSAQVAILLTHGVVWLLTSASEAVKWWWIAERVGIAIGDTVTAPSTAAAIAAVEMAILLAIYAYHQLLDED